MHKQLIAHHPPTDDLPVCKQWLFPQATPESFFIQFRSAAWFCPLPTPCTSSAPLTDSTVQETGMFLALCSTITETLVCFQHCFSPKEKHSILDTMQ